MKNIPLQTEDSVKLVNDLNIQQSKRFESRLDLPRVKVLFNKGRYFEMSVFDNKLRTSISKAIKSKVQHRNMLVDSKIKLESLIKAFNKRGYYVDINLDWI